MHDQAYCYGPDWQASVDHNGDAWRHYCLAKSLVRRYVTVRLGQGKQAAMRFWAAEADAYGTSRKVHWEQLRATARLIYTHEGQDIATHVAHTLQATQPAQASMHAVP
jgi:hypothetical protein